MPSLPGGLTPYKRTPLFTQDTVPAGLLRDHQTKAGTWGVLHVVQGTLIYRITDPGFRSEHILDPQTRGIIEPERKHHVELTGEVEFFVEFHR